MARGFVYLVVVMDWASRKVLTWRLSPTLTGDFCVAALEEALDRFGTRGIFNTDQGSQFTSAEFLKPASKSEVVEVRVQIMIRPHEPPTATPVMYSGGRVAAPS